MNNEKTTLYHIDFSFDELKLGGSAFAQSLGKVGDDVPDVYKRQAFFCIRNMSGAVKNIVGRHLNHRRTIKPVSYTHLDVYKRQVQTPS